jgi:hypothetical protein
MIAMNKMMKMIKKAKMSIKLIQNNEILFYSIKLN